MALIDQPLPNLFGGVSQQPALSRYLNQLEAQVNCLADPVEGLQKRPASEWIKKLTTGPDAARPAFFKIDRDQDNRFVGMVSADGTIRVFDTVDGTEKTVTGGAQPYLVSSQPHSDIRTLSVADYTFIVNRTQVVARTDAAAASRPKEALVFARAGNYGRSYSITIKKGATTILGSYLTPDGSSAAHTSSIDTQNIAAQLRNNFNAAMTAAGFTVELIGSLLYITHPSEDFTVVTEDGQGGEALRAYKDNTQRFTDLPRTGKEGIVLRIAGDQTSSFDDYWVRYTGTVWEETIQPGLYTQLDASTLPVALVRNPDGTFTVGPLPWVNRAVGDDDSNPFPSFVGGAISSMFYFRNRIGFLSDENVILSQAGDYFNYFRTSVTTLLDGDPIDTPASDASGESSPVSILEHAVAFDKKLVIFARNAQFIMGSNGLLTAGEAEIDPVTSFSCSPTCRPTAAGRYIYFAFDRDGASGVREFYVDGAAQTEDAEEVTAHVPTFLPSGILSMSTSTLENVIVALPETGNNKLYVYEYFWGDREKLQSAWGKWEFSPADQVLWFDFIENVGYMVVQRTDGYHLEKLRFRPGLVDTGLDYFTRLDSRLNASQFTMSYSALTQQTTITLPFDLPTGVVVATVKSPTNIHAPGLLISPVSTGSATIVVDGNKTTWSLVIGVPYNQSFTLTRPYAVSGSGSGGTVANTEAILKIRDYSLDYAGAGYFKATFTPRYRTPVVKEFSGRILGATPLSIPPLEEGTFRIKTPTKNTLWSLTIDNASIFPSRFLSASWRGILESKSQRV
jgi:hypothetical protein